MKNERKRSLIWSAFVGVALGALTAQAQTNFYWTNLVDGAWDATGNWTNAIPAAGGGTNYVLNFLTPATTVSTTNTLGVGGTTNGFLLNSLNVSNVALTIWGSNLVFITGGTTLPTFNQNGASSVVFNVGLVLSNDTTFGGSGSGAVLINSNVTGSGQFLKSGSNTLTLAGVNSYTNNTVISNGTLAVTNGGWINSPLATLNVLKGSNALSGGTIIVRTLLVTNNTLTATNAFFGFNSGTLTTSNANGLAANILLASNTSWNINGNWTMNGGTNRIVSVQTNGSWNNVYIGNSVSNAAVYVNSNAVWSLGTNATGVTSGTNNLNLYVGNNAGGSNNTLQINGGLVTNVYQVFLGGTAAGASGNQLIITNGGRLYIGNAAVSSASGTIGASANSNSVVIAGTNSAGGKATWDLGGSRLVVGANGYTGNWIRVDQGGLITNFVLMSYGVGSSVIITNGGLAVSSTGAGYTYVGRGGSISNSLIVAGADGSGTKATLNNNGVGFNIAGNGNAQTGNWARVDQGGIITNVTGVFIGGQLVGDINEFGNYLVITNGGQFFSRSASYIGYSTNDNSNWAWVGGSPGTGTNALWDLGGSTLNIGASKTTNNYLTVAAGGIVTNFSTLTVGADATAFSNSLLVSGGTLFGGAVVVVTNNSFAVNSGSIATLTNITLTATSSVFTVDGGTLVARATNNWISGTGSMTLGAGGMTNDTAGFVATNLVNIGGTGGLIKLGTGILVLSGTNTYTGPTTISTGVLTLGGAGQLGSGSYATAITNNGAFIYNSSVAQTLSGVISGTGVLTNAGPGTLVLTGTNTYGGITTLSGGTLRVGYLTDAGQNSALGTNTITLNAAGGSTATLQYTGTTTTINRNISYANTANATNIIDLPNGSLTENGTVTSAGGNAVVVKTGTGTLTLGGAGDNVYLNLGISSGTAILAKASGTGVHGVNTIAFVAPGATLQIGSSGTGLYQINSTISSMNGTLDLNGQSQIMGAIGGAGLVTNTVATPITLTLGQNNGSVTFTGIISEGASPLNLVKVGTGWQTLGGTNNYSGYTLISAGTLQIGVSGAYSTVSGNITNNATLAFGRSDVYTNANLIVGSGNLVQVGVGTLVLTNALNTYAVGTTISNGNLLVTLLNAAGGGNITVAPNGALVNAGAYTNINDWLNSGRLVPTSAGAIALAANNSENLYMVGAGSAYSNLSLGAAQGANVNFTGNLTPVSSNYYIGGGGGTINFNNNNTFQDGTTARNIVAGNAAGSTVVVAGNNTLGGSLTVASGLMTLATTNSFGGQATINSGATLQIGNGGADGWLATPSVWSNNGALAFNRSDTLTVTNRIAGGGSLSQIGAGTLILSNTTTQLTVFPRFGTVIVETGANVNATSYISIGQTSNDNGTVIVRGTGIFSSQGDFIIGDTAGSTGQLTIANSGVVNAKNLYVGKGANTVGILTMTGGTMQQGIASSADWQLANTASAYGYVNMSGGLLNAIGGNSPNFMMGNFGLGQVDLSGGIISNNAWSVVGRQVGGRGVLNVSGNGLFVNNSANRMIVGELGNGQLNVSGGGTVMLAGGLRIGGSSTGGTGVGVVNLAVDGVINAGTVDVSNLGLGIFNFNGGTLRPTASSATFMQGLTAANVYSNGAIIDSSNFNITIAQALLAPAGNGLTNVSVGGGGGSGYDGPPLVIISGGGGTGATAVAQINASGVVTNIQITSAGYGYTNAPTITLSGGGGSGATATGIGIGLNSSGALTKLGNGTLTLSGANTYTGGTIINAGLLQFNATNAIPTNGLVDINSGGAVAFNYTNLQSTLTGRLDTTSSGTIALLATNTTDAINFQTANLSNAFLGVAPGLVVTNGALFTPYGTNYQFGGGGGILVNTNVIGAGKNITIGGGGALSVVNLTANNLNDQSVTLLGHVLRATDGIGFSTNANLNISGGVLETSGTFTRVTGTLANQVQLTGGLGGFSAFGAPLVVNLGGAGATQVWGSLQFNPSALVLNEITANTNLTFMNALDLNGVGGTFNVNATNANNTVVLMGAITDTAGTANFVKNGAGTLVLSNSTVYGGATMINGGTLRLSNGTANQLPTATAVTLANTPASVISNNPGALAFLDLNGQNQTVSSLNGGSTAIGYTSLNLGAGNLTINGAGLSAFGGTIAGTGGLTNQGGGTLLFSGNQSYSGTTVVNGGALVLTNSGALNSAVQLANGATLTAVGGGNGLMGQFFNVTTNYPAISNLLLFANAYDALTPGFVGASSLTSTNFDMGRNDVVPPGAFTNTPYGIGGSLAALGLTNQLTARWTGKFIAPTNGTYVFDLNSDDGSALFIDGVQVVNKFGAGGFTTLPTFGSTNLTAGVHDIVIQWANGTGGYGLYADVALPGGTTNRLSNGLLSYGPTIGSLSGDASSIVNLSNGVLTVGQSADQTFAGAIIGGTNSGTLVKAGGATLFLTGTNTYGGGTVINNGVLQFASTNAVPTSGLITINAVGGLQGAAAFDFAGVQAEVASSVAKASVGTIALTTGTATENLDFSAAGAALTNAYLGAANSLTYGGTLTPWANTNGSYYRLGGGGGTLTFTNSLLNAYSLNVAGPGGVVLPNGGTMTGPLTLNSPYATLDTAGASLTAGSLAGWGVLTNSTATQGTWTFGSDGTSTTFGGTLGGSNALTKIGTGTLTLANTNTLTGQITVNGGTLAGTTPGSTPFGTGSIVLNGGALSVSGVGGTTSAVALAVTAANGVVGSTFTYGTTGTNYPLILNMGAWTNGLTFTVGNAGAAANSVLVRTNNGVLVLSPTANSNLGGFEKFIVNGGVATNNGMVSASIVARNSDGNNSLDFLNYTNSSTGFVLANYGSTNFTGASASSIVVLTANASNSASQVYALKNNNVTLTLTNTLTLGNGSGEAGLIMNGGIITNTGASSLGFGTAEGVVLVNKQTASIYAPITGSSGVTVYGNGAGPASGLYLYGTNTFTGGLRIMGGTRVIASSAGATNVNFGKGDVYVYGDASGGGQAWLMAPAVYTNNFHIAGIGSTIDASPHGALRITNGVTIAGFIELLGDARMALSVANNTATNTGNIFGNYRLELGGNGLAGTLVMLGTNNATSLLINATVTNQIGNGGILGVLSSPVVSNNGALLFNHSDTVQLTNTIYGSGAILQNGAGTLTLGSSAWASTNLKLSVNSGTFDLAGNSILVNSLSGTGAGAQLINSGVGFATLTNITSATTYAGQLGSNLNLVIAGTNYLVLNNNNSNFNGTMTIATNALLSGWQPWAFGQTTGITINNGGRLELKSSATFTYSNASVIINDGGALVGNTGGGASAWTWTGPITLAGGTNNIAPGGATMTMAGALNGAGTLCLNAAGTVVLTASNSYLGGTLLNAGVLGVGNDNALGTGALTFNGGTLVALGANRTVTNTLAGLYFNIATAAGSNLTFTSAIDLGPDGYSRAFTVNGNVTTLAGQLTNNGDLVVSPGSGVLALSATNTYTGNTYINGGILMADFGVGLQTNSGHIFVEGGTLAPLTAPVVTSSLGLGVGQMSLPGGLGGFSAYGQDVTVALGGVSSPAALVWGADTTFAPLALLLNNTGADHALNFTNSLDFNGADRLIIVNSTNNGAVATISSVIGNSSGVAGLTKGGPGVLALTGNNTYNDTTSVTGGVLRADYGIGLPTASNLVLNGGVWESDGLITNALGFGGGSVSLTNYAGFSAYGAPLTINLATNLITWGSATFAPTNLVLNEYSANANLTFQNNLDLNNASRTIAVNSTNGVVTISGTITNTGTANSTLTKTGPGTLVFNNTTFIRSNLTVSAGTLVLLGNTNTVPLAVVVNGLGASFIITNGAQLTSGANSQIGDTVGNNGNVVLITGVGSVWNAGIKEVTVGGRNNASSSNLLIVANGGALTNLDYLEAGYVSGSLANGIIITNGGLIQIQNTRLDLGEKTGANGNYLIIASSTASNSTLNLGTKVLNIGGGTSGSVSNWALVGAGGTITNGNINIGKGGAGTADFNTLIITNGGQVFSTSGPSVIGYQNGGGTAGSNTVIVTGASSRWDLGGQALWLGYSAAVGNQLIVNAGVVTNISALMVGYNGYVGNLNSVLVTNGGSLYVNGGASYIGQGGGNGGNSFDSLTIAANSLANFGGATLGVGVSGNTGNVLTVSSSGILTNTGAITLAGTGSQFNLAGDATASSVALTGANALLNINGGILRASAGGAFLSGTGTAYVQSAGAVIDSSSFTITNSVPLVDGGGGGGLTKNGVGTLVLNSTNTYTGGTLINAGVLLFSSTNALAGSGQNMQIAFGATAAAGYMLDTNFLNRITLASSGTVALAASSTNDFDFSVAGLNFTNISLGAAGTANATNSGTLTPYSRRSCRNQLSVVRTLMSKAD